MANLATVSMRAYGPYTSKLREIAEKHASRNRGQNGLANQARLAPSRVAEILAGERPTDEEHQRLCRALPELKHHRRLLDAWTERPRPAPAPVSASKTLQSATREPKPAAINVEIGDPAAHKPTQREEAQREAEDASGSRDLFDDFHLPPPTSLKLCARVPQDSAQIEAALVIRPRTFGEFLRAVREDEKLEIGELADLVGVTADAVRKWESDEAIPVSGNYDQLVSCLPRLSEPEIPRPRSRDIQKPTGRPATADAGAENAPSPPAQPGPAALITFGSALAQAGIAARQKSAIVRLLRAGSAAGLTIEQVAKSVEDFKS